MVFYWHLKSFAVREWCVDSNLVAKRIEMLFDIAYDNFVWTGGVFIEPDADVNIGRIAAQQSRLARETVTIN